MRLKNISIRFNKAPIYDAYTGALLFHAHTKAHDDQSSSGATSRRRTMRTAVETTPPARRAVRIDESYWLVGNSNVDSFAGGLVRRNFGLKKSTGLVARLTPGEACTSATGLVMHTHKEFYRDTQDALTTADMAVMWNVFCPYTEVVTRGQFLRQDSRLYLIRNIYTTVDEYQVAEAAELDADALQSVTFVQTGKLDVATDTIPEVSVTVSAIQTDVPNAYHFRDLAEADRQPGDRAVFVAKSAVTPSPNSCFSMEGADWRALAVVSQDDAWVLHARLA